jgi:cardiolipin synthase
LTFLFSGEETYHDILRIIGSAQQSVHVATYVLGRDETGRAIVDALSRKAADGLDVCLMMDALGSVTIDSGFLSPLHKAGGRTAFFMPMAHMPFRGRANLRNHRKMVIVDGQTAIVGGMNLGKEYMGPGAEEDRWMDFSLRITGPAVGQALELFRSDWAFAATEALERPTPPRQAPDDTASSALQFLASGPDVENDALREALMMSLFRAAERVWMVTPYFVPDDLLLEALCLAAKRGIDLRLVIPKKSNHRLADLAREGYLSELQESGAQVYLYRPRMLHAKAILIDHTVAITGSANLDMRSLLLNYEVGLCIYSQDEIRQLKTWMHDLMADCTPRHAHGSTMRSIIEGVARLFAPLL